MSTERELLKGNTPTLVLAVLQAAPLHGYGIAREIERRSGNALKFKEGTLYPALHALEREGLITGAWSGESVDASGRSTTSRRRDWPSWSDAPAPGPSSPPPSSR